MIDWLILPYILGAMVGAGAFMEASAQSSLPVPHRIYAAILAAIVWPGSALRAVGKALTRK